MRKSLKALFLLPVICLTSCGEPSFLGTYAFRLGKEGESEAHVGLTMVLKNDDYKMTPTGETEPKIMGKTFEVKMDLGADLDLGEITKALKKGVKGYYNIKNSKTKYGNRLSLGAEFTHETFPTIIPEGIKYDLDPELLQYIAVSYVDKRNLTIQIPVSLNDLKHQLTWYGKYINLNALTIPGLSLMTDLKNLLAIGERMPGDYQDEERFGTHPQIKKDEEGHFVADDAAQMNLRFEAAFSNTTVYTRADGEGKRQLIGRLTNPSYETDRYYYNGEYNVTQPALVASILQCSLYNSSTNGYYDVDITVNKQDYETTRRSEISTIVSVSSGKEIDPKDVMVEPFVFRDFHDIKLGLIKE